MSISKPDRTSPPSVESRLIVRAPSGVMIEVFDAAFLPVESGVGLGELDLALPDGLYTIRFTAAGQSQEQIVRLLPIAKPLVINGGDFALQSASPSTTPDVSPHERGQAAAVAGLSALSGRGEHAQEIVIFVRAPDLRTRADVSRSLRLVDLDGAPMRSRDEEALSAAALAQGYAARRYSVPAGIFGLRFDTFTRRRVQQTVYAWPRRRTFAFVEYGSIPVNERHGERFRRVRRRGIDPARTVLISTRSDQSAPTQEALRVADILLHAVRNVGDFLDPVIVDQAQQSGCPFLALYAAAAIASRMELSMASAEVRWPNASRLRKDWEAKTAEDLLANLPRGSWPDGLCLEWRLSTLSESKSSSKGALVAPPLLDCAWRWASARSVSFADAMAPSSAFYGAARAREPAGPWLVWRTAQALTSKGPDPIGPDGLDKAIEAVTDRLGLSGIKADKNELQPEYQLITDSISAKLSPAARLTANAVQTLAMSGSATGPIDPAALAGFMGLPAAELSSQLSATFAELSGDEAPLSEES